MLRLVGTLGDRAVVFTLSESAVVGSAPECEVRVQHPSVSRRHAELRVEAGGLRVIDLESRNGSFVDGQRVGHDAVASAGAQLTFGRVTLSLEAVDEAEATTGLELPRGRPAPLKVDPLGAATTGGTRALEDFAAERLPRLLELLREAPGVVRMAGAVGVALHESLGAIAIEVADGDAQLFAAHREAAGRGETLRREAGELSVTVELISPAAARLAEPLVLSAVSLLALAAARAVQPGPREAALPPSPPDPPSSVPAVQRVYAEAARAARGEVGILICGESGTGKELLAHYVHAASPRAGQRLVALNCAALPRDLLEAELFGIERGVATGVEARPGKFELADGGTLFLDEIGDMALETQARILRVLQEGEVFRIGGSSARPARVRIVAATHRDLHKLIEAGAFREDLYYRTATWTAALPPLRQRRADIGNLAAHFLAREAEKLGVRVRGISRGALEVLRDYRWPGNVRQLEKEMARAVLFLAGRELLESPMLSEEVRAKAPPAQGRLKELLEDAERRAIAQAIEECGGDVGLAAAELGLARSTLYRRIKDLGLQGG